MPFPEKMFRLILRARRTCGTGHGGQWRADLVITCSISITAVIGTHLVVEIVSEWIAPITKNSELLMYLSSRLLKAAGQTMWPPTASCHDFTTVYSTASSTSHYSAVSVYEFSYTQGPTYFFLNHEQKQKHFTQLTPVGQYTSNTSQQFIRTGMFAVGGGG